MLEPLLLTTTAIRTFAGNNHLTNATGFFFRRGARLFLVTSRHVVIDEPSGHMPDRIEFEVHTDAINLTQSIGFSILLYRDGTSIWRQGQDSAGSIDVAVVEIDREALPDTASIAAFTPENIPAPELQPEIGSSLLVIGFPLGFHDTLHHMPVVRHAVIASSFGLRFQGNGYFLADGRTHRGTSGAPVVMKTQVENSSAGQLPYYLLGIHSARLDVGTRDHQIDEALGLNCTWYADILMTLTES
ncbi:serine protease [Hoeflea sp. WL0058]|uniref:Serine protease n=1 Tax=Flavimaribacter sediminis TaxID=2865987 RepID=A0AAE2ZK92_9HYPH|nr:serine protease [Flavimaribacter sediminis]MBW8635848.1 serine protease [Flavimaribacter sediminis]